ncbi:type II secretion system F family protein [Aeromicrobium halocynthiae]|uniref:Type II secretion system F family protein n=1 Tax=Aeromicrobium halocynthiae TaxID=560557 RepID=A0ABN2WA07_9ACTN
MIAELAAGAMLGAGVALLVSLLAQPRPGIAATVARLERSGRRTALTRSAAGAAADGRLDRARQTIGARLESEATLRGWQLRRTRTDLAVMNRTLAHHLGTKALLGLAAFIWFPSVVTLLGYASGPGVPVVVAAVAGLAGFMLPDLQLRRDAEQRRRDFRHVVGSFLDLVAMNLAGGRGLPEALMAASSFGDHWAMVRLRQALSNARIMGWTPWESIARLGEDLGVAELRDLASALALAGDEGARIRSSLMARAESMRRKELVDVEGAAGESSQSMLLAQLLMCIAFLVFLSYPAVSQLGS